VTHLIRGAERGQGSGSTGMAGTDR
jgi:hypothetical protein